MNSFRPNPFYFRKQDPSIASTSSSTNDSNFPLFASHPPSSSVVDGGTAAAVAVGVSGISGADPTNDNENNDDDDRHLFEDNDNHNEDISDSCASLSANPASPFGGLRQHSSAASSASHRVNFNPSSPSASSPTSPTSPFHQLNHESLQVTSSGFF